VQNPAARSKATVKYKYLWVWSRRLRSSPVRLLEIKAPRFPHSGAGAGAGCSGRPLQSRVVATAVGGMMVITDDTRASDMTGNIEC
jgi:hypothetical protein